MVIVVPKEIKIGGHTFRVVFDRGLDADGLRARIDYKRLVVSINPDKKDSLKAEGLLHELIHGVSEVYLNDRIGDENLVEPLAEGLWQVLDQLGVKFDWGNLTDETRE